MRTFFFHRVLVVGEPQTQNRTAIVIELTINLDDSFIDSLCASVWVMAPSLQANSTRSSGCDGSRFQFPSQSLLLLLLVLLLFLLCRLLFGSPRRRFHNLQLSSCSSAKKSHRHLFFSLALRLHFRPTATPQRVAGTVDLRALKANRKRGFARIGPRRGFVCVTLLAFFSSFRGKCIQNAVRRINVGQTATTIDKQTDVGVATPL